MGEEDEEEDGEESESSEDDEATSSMEPEGSDSQDTQETLAAGTDSTDGLAATRTLRRNRSSTSVVGKSKMAAAKVRSPVFWQGGIFEHAVGF